MKLPAHPAETTSRLPAICFSYFVFPFMMFKLSPPFAEGLEQAFIGALRGKNKNEFLILFPDPQAFNDHADKTHKLSSLLKIGVVASIEHSDKNFIVTGQYRANALTFEQDTHKKKLGWVTTEKRPDIPTLEEITTNLQHAELPMLLGCVETIRRLLKEIYDNTVPWDDDSKKFKENLAGQIRRLKNELREPYTPYQICWHIPGITFDHISDIYKAKLLAENNMVDRLQLVIEALQLEKRILTLQDGLQIDRIGCQDNEELKGK